MLFFVSVGMLFDPSILWTRSAAEVIGTLFIILIGKSVLGFLLVVALRRPIGDGADRLGEPRADRRILVHPRGARHQPRPHAARGAEPDRGRRHHLDRSQSAADVLGAEQLRPALKRAVPYKSQKIGGPPTAPDLAHDPRRASPRRRKIHDEAARPTALTGHTVLIGYGRVGTRGRPTVCRRQGTPFVVDRGFRERGSPRRMPRVSRW